MPNSLSASFAQIWSKEQQYFFGKTNVAKMIADMSFESDLNYGNILTRPYRSVPVIQQYTPGTDITIDDLTDTGENLTVNQKFAAGFYRDDFDQIQDKYDIAASYGKDYGIALSNQVDATVLGEVANVNSNNVVDDGSIGGTSGNAISLSTSNVWNVCAVAKQALQKQNVPFENYFAVVSPEFENILIQAIGGKDTGWGDEALRNGFIKNFYGIDFYRSNQLMNTVVASQTTNPTDGDTITLNINGTPVVFTFRAVLTTAGSVIIGASATATGDNLVSLITTPGTTTATGIAFTGTTLRKLQNLVSAVNVTGTVTINIKGSGVVTTSSTYTSANNSFTAAKHAQRCMFGVKGRAPTLIIQKEPEILITQEPKRMGKNILNGVLYGVKTFTDQAKMLVDVRVKASSYTAQGGY